MGLIPEPEYIHATASVSQQLAEAFKWNSEPQDYEKHIPPHLCDFHSVFSKVNFDDLSQSKPWDHAVELIPDADTSKSCKGYPLSVSEQKELDEFLKENLDSGCICPSKSPMASPVFFVKKKCSGLRLIQDYQALNAMTVKNKYPLLLIPELISKLQGSSTSPSWMFNGVWQGWWHISPSILKGVICWQIDFSHWWRHHWGCIDFAVSDDGAFFECKERQVRMDSLGWHLPHHHHHRQCQKVV